MDVSRTATEDNGLPARATVEHSHHERGKTLDKSSLYDETGPHHLERIDPAHNMARYYTLSVEVTLFDDWSCTRTFGRIGGRGRRIMVGLFEQREEAQAALQAILKRKIARGYACGRGQP